MESGGYRITRTIATGGTSVIYEAVQRSLDRRVVIKRLHSHLTSDPAFKGRFEVEARAAASLDHENIVRIIDSGVSRGSPFIVMEFIDGLTLRAIMDRRGRIDEVTALLIAREICLGLDHAHRSGIVHRDIKPANIMISSGGQVKITDFGLVKLCQSRYQQTVADTLLGTPLYMSPEQAAGEGVDGRSDLFSLGTICYEMVTGTQPFGGKTYASVIQNIMEGRIAPPSRVEGSVGRAAESIIMRALAREPGRRHGSAAEMAAAIEKTVEQDRIISARRMFRRLAGGVAPPPSADGPAFGERRRRRGRFLRVASIVALAAAGAAWLAADPGRLEGLRDLASRVTGPSGERAVPAEPLPASGGGPAAHVPPAPPEPAVTSKDPPAAAAGREARIVSASDTVTARVDHDPDTTCAAADEEPVAADPAAPDRRAVPEGTEEAAEPAPPVTTGLLEISVDPEADITIDGRLRTSASRFGPVEIEAGRHELVLRQTGYRDYREDIFISRGELSRRRVELAPLTGSLDFATVPGAGVYINGEYRGRTPLAGPLLLEAGKYIVELRKPGFVTWTGQVDIPPDELLRLGIDLVPSRD